MQHRKAIIATWNAFMAWHLMLMLDDAHDQVLIVFLTSGMLHSTSSSLDKNDDDATSDAHDDSTSSTLGGDLDDVGSCSSHDHDATTSSPSSPHCFISQGDTKV